MQKFVGFSDNAMIYNRQYVITPDRPGVTTLRNGFVSGMRPSTEGNYLEDLIGGAFTADGQFVDASAQPRSDGRNAIKRDQEPAQPPARETLPKAVFAGIAFDHFGHFLLETTARLWALPEYKDWAWLFLTAGQATLPSYQIGFLELLGLSRDQIIPVADCRAVDELVIPQPAFVYHHWVTQAYRETFRRARLLPRQGPARRIFLSRSNMTIALTVGEHELEERLAQDGWEIVYPETLPPMEQALLFHEDNIILGLQGSAMHLGLFAPAGRRVVHLCRGQGYRGYYILDDLVDADAIYFQAMENPTLRSRPITGPFLLNLDDTFSFLRAEGLLGISSAPVATAVAAGCNERLMHNYEAWWHYTESQIRLHRQVDDEGEKVPSSAALEPALTAVALWPDNAELLAHAAALALKFEGPAAAETVLRRFRPDLSSTTRKADSGLVHLLSTVLDGQGRHAPALVWAEHAHRLEPDNTTYSNQLAIALLRLERWDEVQDILQRVVSAGRDNAVTHCLLSMLHEGAGRTDDAIAAMFVAVRLDRHDGGLCQRLVKLLRAQGQHDKARDILAAHLDGHWNNPALLLEMVDIEASLDHPTVSDAYLRQAFIAAPGDLQVRNRYVQMAVARGILPALTNLGRQPSSAICQQSVMIYQQSLALAAEGKLDHALRVAVKAAELFPDNVVILNSLLGLMLRNGQAEDARLLVELVIAGREVAGETYYVLSLIEGKLGDHPAALEAARQASLREPGNDVIVEHYRRMRES